jgi:hypothetical protein
MRSHASTLTPIGGPQAGTPMAHALIVARAAVPPQSISRPLALLGPSHRPKLMPAVPLLCVVHMYALACAFTRARVCVCVCVYVRTGKERGDGKGWVGRVCPTYLTAEKKSVSIFVAVVMSGYNF